MLVLGALGFRDRKETDTLQIICSDCETIGILEDEDDSWIRNLGLTLASIHPAQFFTQVSRMLWVPAIPIKALLFLAEPTLDL